MRTFRIALHFVVALSVAGCNMIAQKSSGTGGARANGRTTTNQGGTNNGKGTPPNLRITSPGEFGSVPAGGTSRARKFTLFNLGSRPATKLRIDFPKPFEVVGNECGAVLEAGATCTFTAAFRPQEVGPVKATYTIEFYDGDVLLKAVANLSGKGMQMRIAMVANNGHVLVYDMGKELSLHSARVAASLFAFPGHFGAGSLALCDMDDDGYPELAITPGKRAAPHVKVFDGRDWSLRHSFYAFEPAFLGGINVACTPGTAVQPPILAVGVERGPSHVKFFAVREGGVQLIYSGCHGRGGRSCTPPAGEFLYGIRMNGYHQQLTPILLPLDEGRPGFTHSPASGPDNASRAGAFVPVTNPFTVSGIPLTLSAGLFHFFDFGQIAFSQSPPSGHPDAGDGVRTASGDTDGDENQQAELYISMAGGRLLTKQKVNGKQSKFDIDISSPYPGYFGSLCLAISDLDGKEENGVVAHDVVVSPAQGGGVLTLLPGPHRGTELDMSRRQDVFPYGAGYRGPIFVAAPIL